MLRLTRLLRDVRERDEGVSIVEVLVAMTVFALIAAGVAMGVAGSLYLSYGSRSREVAIGLAQDAIDVARTQANINAVVDTSTTRSVNRVDYTVAQTSRWVAADRTGNVCGATASGSPLGYRRVAVNVSWTAGGRGSRQSITMNSLVSPTTAVSSANLGTIIITVSRVDGSGNGGVGVTITPNKTNPAGAAAITSTVPSTDATGCSYATNVAPGRYDVTLSKSGNIDDGTSAGSLGAQTTSPSTTVTVTANKTSSASFNYDAASTYTLRFQDPNQTTTPFVLPDTISTTLRHKGNDYGPFASSSTQMFPYADGYTIVPGSPATCASVDPQNWTTANGTAVAPRGTTYAPANAGDAVTAYAPVQILTVKLAGKSDNALTATTVTPQTGSGDPGCATSVKYTFTGLSNTATIALPYGTYTLQSGVTVSVLGVVSVSFSSGTPNVSSATGVSSSSNKVLLDPRRKPSS